MRFIKEIQGHMRLRASGDRHQIRQEYFPLLWQKLVDCLNIHGKEGVADVISLMDSYFLTKDDWDAMIELGIGPMHENNVKLDAQTKATFTRMYNQQSHPLPYIKASQVVQPKKVKRDAPDLEEAIEESDDGAAVASEDEGKGEEEEEELDLKKDKYVKAPKKKAGTAKKDDDGQGKANGKAKGKGKGKGKGKAKDESDEEEEENLEDRKRGKPSGRGRGGGRGGRGGRGKGKV